MRAEGTLPSLWIRHWSGSHWANTAASCSWMSCLSDEALYIPTIDSLKVKAKEAAVVWWALRQHLWYSWGFPILHQGRSRTFRDRRLLAEILGNLFRLVLKVCVLASICHIYCFTLLSLTNATGKHGRLMIKLWPFFTLNSNTWHVTRFLITNLLILA